MRNGIRAKRGSWVLLAFLTLALGVLGGAAAPKLPRDLVIGTAPTGTTHYLGSSAVAKEQR